MAGLLEQCLAHVQQPAGVPAPHAARTTSKRQKTTIDSRWSIAAAALLLFAATLALAETTGLTHLSASVIRIVRGDGTLVVEVDDPNIQVLLDGDEIAITGAGPKELRLRPGQHELHAIKDGSDRKADIMKTILQLSSFNTPRQKQT